MKILGLNPPSKYSKNVARDLLWGCWCKGRRIAGVQFPPLPLIYVGTILKLNGHKVDIIDAQAQGISLSKIEEKIKDYDIAFIISATMSYAEDADILGHLKKNNPRLITIVFGAHPTFLPLEALKRNSVDIIVRKEAEFIIRDLVNAFSQGKDQWKKINGIGYKEDGHPVLNPDYPYIDNLDVLPIPDRGFLPKNVDYYNPIIKNIPWTTALSSRGCPSRCTFCTSYSYYGPKYRARSPENVVEEINYLKELGFREIFYRDELFTLDKKRVIDICQLILDKNIHISWICSVKASTSTYEMLKMMKKAGCRLIRVGVESGVQEVLDNVKKDVKLEQIVNTFRWARELNIDTHAHLMLGMPGETDQTIRKTFCFVKKIKPSTVTYGIMTPYPGTEIYREVLAADPSFGDGTHINARSIHTNASFSKVFSNIPQRKLERYVRNGYMKFYMRPEYIARRLLRINDADELRRLVFAGSQVFNFIARGDE
jgi:radical SAM superfamily enzyme YgiQ (UPF0313 family)